MEAYRAVARLCLPPVASEFPNFSRVPSMVDNGRIGYKDLALITEVLPYLSEGGLKQLEQNFDTFLNTVAQKAQMSDVTYVTILRSFLFQEEASRINTYLNEHQADTAPEKRREVRMALMVNECQFDLRTVSEYFERQDASESRSLLEDDPEATF